MKRISVRKGFYSILLFSLAVSYFYMYKSIEQKDERSGDKTSVSEFVPDILGLSGYCNKLKDGDQKERKFTVNLRDSNNKTSLGPQDYLELTKSCNEFRKRRGYIMDVSEEEEDFPVAFGILVHKDIEIVERLLRAIYRPNNYYCLHADAKTSPEFHKAISAIANCLPNVFKSSKSINVRWGKFTVFEADLTCMDEMLKFPNWKYYINLAGQEFPLKTNLEMVAILKALNGASSVTFGKFSPSKWQERMSRLNLHHPAVSDINFVKGSQHIVANRHFITYIRTSPKALKIVDLLRSTTHPHETFYNSIYTAKALKIPGNYNGDVTGFKESEGIARYKIWSYAACSGKVVRQICIFGPEEYPGLLTAPHLFANKFNAGFMPLILDCLELWIFSKVSRERRTGEVAIDLEYYRNLEYVKNKV